MGRILDNTVKKEPNKPIAERFEMFLSKMDECGDSEIACKFANISINSATYMRKNNPEFAAGWELAEEKHGTHRKYRSFLDVFSKTGNVTEACRLADLKRSDVLARKRIDPEFSDLYQEAVDIGNDYLEAEARRRAVNGTKKPIVQGGRVVYMQHPDTGELLIDPTTLLPIPMNEIIFSDKLLETLLKANNPDKFRENIKVDHNVTGGVLLLSSNQPTEVDWEKRMEQKRLESQQLKDVTPNVKK